VTPFFRAAVAAFAVAAAVLPNTVEVAWAAPPLAVSPASFSPPSGPAVSVRSQERDGKSWLAVNDVVSALGGQVTWDSSSGSYEAALKGHSAVFGVETPVAVVDTRLVSLATPVRGEGPDAFADPDFFVRVVGPLAGAQFAWDRGTRVLSARRAEVPEVSVEVSVADFESTTKVVLRLSEAHPYRVEKGEDLVLVRFPSVHLVASPAERLLENPRVARLLVRGTDVAVTLREKGLSTNVYALSSPPRVVIDVTRVVVAPRAAGPASAAPPLAEGTGAAGAKPPLSPGGVPPAPRPEPKTVVLDPGHGGTEQGAKGPEGILEKDATLALVKTLREVLVRHDYRVVTTRDSDAGVSLEERSAAANAAKADVFLSIHANASRAGTAHGTEVYYLSLDSSDRAAAALAESENRLSTQPTPTAEENAALRDLDLILWDLTQNQHLSASARLAETIQADFNRLLGVTSRGVKQAPFKVLIGVNAPAVLVEVAFITNPEEEKRLASEEFRRQVAETLAGSLESFFGSAADARAPVPATLQPATPASPRVR